MNPGPLRNWRHRLTAPALAFVPPLLLAWWAFPDGLPAWRTVAIVSAWASMGMLATCALLMVREPHLANVLGGLETSYRWHHRVGALAYLALLAHPIALAMDGWTQSPHTAWQSLAPWLQAWPVWLGWAALVLVMVGLTATFSVHLPYRRWRKLHVLLGAGVLLGFAHVWVVLGEPSRFLGILALAVLALGWRFVATDLGLAARPYCVSSIAHPAAGTIEVSLAPCSTSLAVTPGQFVLAAFGNGAHYRGCGEYHPFTVSHIEADRRLRLTVKALGPCSQRLQTLEPGVLVRLQGPFGSFLPDTANAPELWIAGGIGITPFMAALRARSRIQPTTLIYLYRRAAEAPFLDELNQLAALDPQFELIAEATGDRPPNADTLMARVPRLPERRVYLCGPPAMVDALAPSLIKRGVSPRSIHYERFDFRS